MGRSVGRGDSRLGDILIHFEALAISGVWLMRPDIHQDVRGFFVRYTCEEELAAQGLVSRFVQTSAAGNHLVGTLRGMHYLAASAGETKIIRCVSGKVFDVLVDLRPDSSTFKKWISLELSEESHLGLYVPPGVAHGYQTLGQNVRMLYQMSSFYKAELECGFRWNDPAFGIPWPYPSPILSPRDAALPFYST